MGKKYFYEGDGINRKTGKAIKFRVPKSISDKGIELLRKNVEKGSDDKNTGIPFDVTLVIRSEVRRV